ncbi:unnamed protein product [Psylliodes chrysocephalus]|uniref:Uncharacterized protein n=1 Tax=Psylliodes chrysocephalus TaxID=3402493 RepID=A0A9P0D0I7_9CUCU|nr:unnamed protein product [Psylliodes chrysocephala]
MAHITVLTAKSTFKLEKLPPTVGATSQHSYRGYFQLQTWFGNKRTATNWGWKESIANNSKIRIPRFTIALVIPEELLKTISCRCETSFKGNRCGCQKHRRMYRVMYKVSENCSDSEDISTEIKQPSLLLQPGKPITRGL